MSTKNQNLLEGSPWFDCALNYQSGSILFLPPLVYPEAASQHSNKVLCLNLSFKLSTSRFEPIPLHIYAELSNCQVEFWKDPFRSILENCIMWWQTDISNWIGVESMCTQENGAVHKLVRAVKTDVGGHGEWSAWLIEARNDLKSPEVNMSPINNIMVITFTTTAADLALLTVLGSRPSRLSRETNRCSIYINVSWSYFVKKYIFNIFSPLYWHFLSPKHTCNIYFSFFLSSWTVLFVVCCHETVFLKNVHIIWFPNHVTVADWAFKFFHSQNWQALQDSQPTCSWKHDREPGSL